MDGREFLKESEALLLKVELVPDTFTPAEHSIVLLLKHLRQQVLRAAEPAPKIVQSSEGNVIHVDFRKRRVA